jgi:anaerobic selenocysteine-containing dehydrogenase
MTLLPSACPLDCPDRCSLDVEVLPDGRVGRLHGSHLNPATAGVICGKVAKFARRVHGPERVTTPMRRVGPKGPGARFEPASWDEALDAITARLKAEIAAHGAESILPYWYAGSNGYVTGGGVDARLWALLGTTNIERTFCAANTGAGVKWSYGDLPGTDPLDVDHARGLLLWGMNPSASGIHLVPRVQRLLERGGELVVVDPRRIPLATKAALHVAPLPGTDVALALAVAHLAFRSGRADRAFLGRWAADADAFEAVVAEWTPERAARVCDVPAARIEELAERYGTPGPWLLRCGWGVERSRNGTDAVRAILSLPAVYGHFGQRGAGWALSTSAGYRTHKAALQVPHRARTVNMAHLGRVLLEAQDPPIRAVYVYDCNPVATAPDQARVVAGLSRPDLFVVVHEQSWTDTCELADWVLPATTFLEHQELTRSYGGYLFQWAEPVIPPVGESRCNHDVIRELATRLGVTDPRVHVTAEALAEEVVNHTPAAGPGTWDKVHRERFVQLPSPVQFVDTFPSDKIRLVAGDAPRYRPPPVDADRPLILVSPASSRGISSTLFETLAPGAATVDVHPDDAAARGLSEGDVVRVHNSVGQATLRLRLDPSLRPGVVQVQKGTWRRSTLDGWTGNALVPDVVDERGGGVAYNDARVELTRG